MLRDVEARVIRNTRLSPDYNVIALAAPDIAAATRPGQFVMVKSGGSGDPLLRRPFSVFEVLRSNNGVDGLTLLSKRIGVTTSMLFDAVEGDTISCLGPLGRPFELVDPPAEAWMVAGGVGLAPFATLGDALLARGTKTTLFYGARSGAELFYLDWFRSRGIRLVLSTEDGSIGDRARITVPLERELRDLGSRPVPAVMIYACGPEPMLEAVTHVAARFTCPSQVSVERVMGCGMGGCYSCVIPVRDDAGSDRLRASRSGESAGADREAVCQTSAGCRVAARPDVAEAESTRPAHHYVRSCIAGPVFRGDDLVWD
ncbi:MAG TPA: dihydroorotate dehydrogenase electron transfer subunit [Vicinamibacterales bacterium]|nr:dihydroorotate dehydrogenase electron transfer subunit [Vicinamibacterales bacterium]